MMLRWVAESLMRQTARGQFVSAVSGAAREALQSATERDSVSAADLPNPPPCNILLAFALGVEAGGTVDLLRESVTSQCQSFLEHRGSLGQQQVAVVQFGLGRAKARQGTADAIVLHRPSWVVSAGFAGALSPALGRGDIVMADEVVDTDGSRLEIGLKMDRQALEATPRLHTGRLLTVDELVRTVSQRTALANEYEAIACDMETSAVAAVCRREKVRFLSVRIISDVLDDELPAELKQMLGQKSLAGKLGAATGAIFHRPGSLKDLWKLKEDALKTSDRLASFLTGVLPQLQGPEA